MFRKATPIALPRKWAENNKSTIVTILFLVVYFLMNLLFLTQYPFVHSDESWLSGLTRNMLESKDLGVTETFYDLKPRYPHAIKTIFHLLQMPFLMIFGYHVFSFRLLSLITSMIVLFLFQRFLLRLSPIDFGNIQGNRGIVVIPILGMAMMASSIQFIYAAHFARQEIILVLALVSIASLLYKEKPIPAAIITGLSIGLHPNSFILGMMGLLMLLPEKTFHVRPLPKWRPLLQYVGVTACIGGLFLATSLSFDSNFFSHYLAYGQSEFDIAAPITSKLGEFPYFLQKIWFQVSGTYHVPNIRIELIIFGVAFLASLWLFFHKKKTLPTEQRKPLLFVLQGLLGIFLGMVIIGRYNQTSIVFFFPLFFALLYLLLLFFWQEKNRKKTPGLWLSLAAIIIVLFLSTISNISPWLTTHYSYDRYLNEISKAIPSHAKVLANLNSEYYFENDGLRDYRNLSYLKENNLSLSEYLEENQIQYIVISDELDLIYQKRPIWNMIYGNLRYMDELKNYLQESCTLVHEFQDNVYGIRIVQYMESDLDFTVYVFKIDNFVR